MSSFSDDFWFEHNLRIYPHHTDYAGVVWHGTYVEWMEAARIECLRFWGLDYADLVALGCELPVVDLSIRYRRPVRMGSDVVVCAKLLPITGIRLKWDYEIWSCDRTILYTTAAVTLVPVDPQGKIMRQLPMALKDVLPINEKNS